MAGYPVREMAGLVFAYLGPAPAPLLPRWEQLLWDNAVRDIAISELPCNLLQCQENSLDPVHVEWLHSYMGAYVRTDRIAPAQEGTGRQHQKIGFDEFEYGIIKRRVLLGKDETDDEWKEGLLEVASVFGTAIDVALRDGVGVDVHACSEGCQGVRPGAAPILETREDHELLVGRFQWCPEGQPASRGFLAVDL